VRDHSNPNGPSIAVHCEFIASHSSGSQSILLDDESSLLVESESESESESSSSTATQTQYALQISPLLDVSLLDGELLDGELLDGELLEGELLDGELLEGELLDGELLEGELLEGELLDGELLEGELLDESQQIYTHVSPASVTSHRRPCSNRSLTRLSHTS